jgi:hypothetical protein
MLDITGRPPAADAERWFRGLQMLRDGRRHDPRSHGGARVARRLRLRSQEIEAAIYGRVVDAVPDSPLVRDTNHQIALREAIATCLGHGLHVIERGGAASTAIPETVLAHARRAARGGASLGIVLRCCLVANARLGEFIADEAERAGIGAATPARRHLRVSQEAVLEGITLAIANAYDEGYEQARRSPDEHVFELVQRLLAGGVPGPRETTELGYELNALWHLGVIATGAEAKKTLQLLRSALGCELLYVPRSDGSYWAWLGSSRPSSVGELERRLSPAWLANVRLALGEPAQGIDGWRLTHRQARAALCMGVRGSQPVTRYADDPLLAAGLRDEVLSQTLKETFLAPLGQASDKRGASLRETLRAYFRARCNAATAAVVLEVDRHTVERRLRTIEKQLGRPPQSCQAELEVALRLEEIEDSADAREQSLSTA